MRLWSIHPSYLDTKGLVALWREALLAQKVLQGITRGYTRHPQLQRFRESDNPAGAIADYLRAVHSEAVRRGYSFDGSKINGETLGSTIDVTSGQVVYETNHLLKKLEVRDGNRFLDYSDLDKIPVHPLFREVEGGIEEWERSG